MVDQPSPLVLPWFIKHNNYKESITLQNKTKSFKSPQKLTQLSPRSYPRHLVGKRTAQKDAIKDITSDSQVNSNFPYRWSHLFNLFLYLYITKITINDGTPHLKSPENQNRRAALGRPAIKLLGQLYYQTITCIVSFAV